VIKGLSVLLIILMAILALCGATYSSWRDRVWIKSKVRMGNFYVDLGSCKVRMNGTGEADVSCGNPAKVWVRGNGSWGVWVGLIIANEGSLPFFTKYRVNLPEGFSCRSYFYGPYKRSIPREVWAFWNGSIVSGYNSRPPGLSKGYKFVAWHYIKFNGEVPPNSTRSEDGVIVYRAWFTLWSANIVIRLHFDLFPSNDNGE